MADPEVVTISTEPTSLAQVVAIARGSTVELAGDAMERVAASRAVVDEAIARGDLVYGVTTAVGHARDEALPVAALRSLQPVLVDMHLGGMGGPLSAARVRAGMAARLAGFTRGGAGVSVPVVRAMAALLNAGITPRVSARGSVGSGDLGQLAMVARVLLGRGTVEVDGRELQAAQALESARLEPVTLEPKDALALMASNALVVGHLALLLEELAGLMALADRVVATSMDALGANPSTIDPVVAAARGSAGQQVTSDNIRRALAGSRRTAGSVSVQDALSFRVAPQVHGACRDVVDSAVAASTAELNAPSDNPMVDLESRRILSNGNFQPMNLALAAESLRVALCHVGLLAERRTGKLWDMAITSLGSPGAGPDGPPNGPPAAANAGPSGGSGGHALVGLSLRYPAAARYTRLRQLAAPVTLDVPPLDLDFEDHASNVAEAVAATEEAVGIVEELLTVELLVAFAVVTTTPGAGDELGGETGELVAAVGRQLEQAAPTDLPADVLARVRGTVR